MNALFTCDTEDRRARDQPFLPIEYPVGRQGFGLEGSQAREARYRRSRPKKERFRAWIAPTPHPLIPPGIRDLIYARPWMRRVVGRHHAGFVDFGVALGGGQAGVAEQLLDASQVAAI